MGWFTRALAESREMARQLPMLISRQVRGRYPRQLQRWQRIPQYFSNRQRRALETHLYLPVAMALGCLLVRKEPPEGLDLGQML
jgi:hypothetical protein